MEECGRRQARLYSPVPLIPVLTGNGDIAGLGGGIHFTATENDETDGILFGITVFMRGVLQEGETTEPVTERPQPKTEFTR